jgi:hypothetical protein
MTAFSSRVKVHNNLEIKGYMEISNEKINKPNININTNPGNSGEKQIR